MERLEPKKISGHTYYYYSGWGWKDGRCRRLWQRYLGTLENLVTAVEGGGPPPEYAEIFNFGLTEALWQELDRGKVVQITDVLCPKRTQGLSVGQYLAIAAMNRAIEPVSKRAMWDWFGSTTLLRRIPDATRETLTSQRFWDHMKKVTPDKTRQIWEKIIANVLDREKIDLSEVSYDGTNFYTFINTFNVKSELARRGKNKQGRCNLRQVSYALFCARDGAIPVFFDVYEGNRNDTTQFPIMCKAFADFMHRLTGQRPCLDSTTVIFDKGNNSLENIELLEDTLKFRFIGSVKLEEHQYLAEISNRDKRFVACRSVDLAGIRAFEVTQRVYGKDRRVVVTYNQELFDNQWKTLNTDIAKALDVLAELKQRLDDRANGTIKGGHAPTKDSVHKQCEAARCRQYLKQLISVTVTSGKDKTPRLDYGLNTEALKKLADTYLGKKLIISNDSERDIEELIVAYHSQYLIEHVFKEMKDRRTGCWWPLHHWTDNQVRVHGLYCTIAALFRAVMLRRIRRAGLDISMRRMLRELAGIREVVNVYKAKRRQRQRTQTVLSKMNEVQHKLVTLLELKPD